MLTQAQVEKAERVAEKLSSEAIRRRKARELYVPADNAQTRTYEEQVVKFEKRRLEVVNFLGFKDLLKLEQRMSALLEAKEWKPIEPLRLSKKAKKIEFTQRQLEIARESLARQKSNVSYR